MSYLKRLLLGREIVARSDEEVRRLISETFNGYSPGWKGRIYFHEYNSNLHLQICNYGGSERVRDLIMTKLKNYFAFYPTGCIILEKYDSGKRELRLIIEVLNINISVSEYITLKENYALFKE